MLLTDLARPRLIVELGTFYGVSYCAFCQAVSALGLDTKCYAIDTWEGDPQSGFYGLDVLNDLKSHHDPLYSSFSTLIKATFDASAIHFAERSIDLLHIDGFHSYEAVTHDFETWLPKMSPQGIILFHDINVREKDFGVWRLWESLKRQFKHFEFIHGYGLGVLAVGESCPKAVEVLVQADESQQAVLRDFFGHLGTWLGQTVEKDQELERQAKAIKDLQRRTVEFELGVAQRVAQEVQAREKQLAEREKQLVEREKQLVEREKQLAERDQQLVQRDQQLRAKSRLSKQNGLPSGSLQEQDVQGPDRRDLVIGVVTYNNSPQQIENLLTSIQLASQNASDLRIDTEIFVVDNGKTSFWKEPGIPISKFDSEGNVGFGRAMNRLMAAAFSDRRIQWFLCLNPDGVLHRNALLELLKEAQSQPNTLFEGRQFPEEHCKRYDSLTLETPWASGACLLIPRAIFEKIGGFDPIFFMYLEDVDFSWRARSAGFSVRVAPKALFGHSVLDRKPSTNTDRAFLLSGRYLAAKWKNESFKIWTENELVSRGYFPSQSELPPLPPISSESNLNIQVSDFGHYFHFASARWG
jgi:GT2 family glycosyltransferase